MLSDFWRWTENQIGPLGTDQLYKKYFIEL